VLVPDTVNVATLQPPAGAGNVVTVLVPGLTEIFADPGALTITIPEPPEPPRIDKDCYQVLHRHHHRQY
jgi:hypothetical protein